MLGAEQLQPTLVAASIYRREWRIGGGEREALVRVPISNKLPILLYIYSPY